MSTTLIETSKLHYTQRGDKPTCEEVQTGALQRIATATELMAKNYCELQDSREWYKKAYHERGAKIEKLLRSNAALRGHLKRLKNNKDAVL